jgi:hypothetical protein
MSSSVKLIDGRVYFASGQVTHRVILDCANIDGSGPQVLGADCLQASINNMPLPSTSVQIIIDQRNPFLGREKSHVETIVSSMEHFDVVDDAERRHDAEWLGFRPAYWSLARLLPVNRGENRDRDSSRKIVRLRNNRQR